MKKQLLLLSFTLLGLGTFAQLSIPNGNFESWTAHQYQNPMYYESSNSETLRSGLPVNCEKTTDAFHGSAAIKLTCVADGNDMIPGYFVNNNPQGDPSDWHGGVAYNQTPTGIRGYFKSDIPAGDTGFVLIAFSKNGLNIGTYFIPVYGQVNTYTLFDAVLSPALPEAPDSVMFGAVCTNVFGGEGVVGSMLQLDSISFTGVASQPTFLNGDFEQWSTVSFETVNNWNIESEPTSVTKVAGAYAGNFAVRLFTEMGDRDGMPYPNSGHISTGFYPRNCDSNCFQQGGYPFTQAVDTVMFWYKYTPAGGSKGVAYATIKSNGEPIGGNMMELNAAASYTLVEMPIGTMSGIPDTLIVDFQSSRWQDSLEAHVGAVLIIDEVQLKSQRLHTGLSSINPDAESVYVYPNPASGYIVFGGKDVIGANYSIVNIAGQVVVSGSVEAPNQRVDVSMLPSGLYFYQIETTGHIRTTGKLRVQ